MSKSRHGRRRHGAVWAATAPQASKRTNKFDRDQRNEMQQRAALLDREADFELQQGHSFAAERLAHQAAEMRGAA